MESRDREKIEPAVDEYKAKVLAEGEVDELLRQAQRMLEMLKCSGGESVLPFEIERQ